MGDEKSTGAEQTEETLIQSQSNGHYLTFNSKLHLYTLDGELVPGCTDVKSGYPKSFVLSQWEIGMGAEYVLDCLTEKVDSRRYPHPDALSEKDAKEIIKGAKAATKKVLTETADVGTLTHDYCWSLRTGRSVEALKEKAKGHPDREKIERRFAEVEVWVAERSKTEKVVAAEEIVASPLHQYAGKFDCLVETEHGLILQDYKSAKGHYVDQYLQGGGYAQAIWEWNGRVVDGIEIIRFNDNTERPSAHLILGRDKVVAFSEQFVLCRKTRLFQRLWEPYFDRLFREARKKK